MVEGVVVGVASRTITIIYSVAVEAVFCFDIGVVYNFLWSSLDKIDSALGD